MLEITGLAAVDGLLTADLVDLLGGGNAFVPAAGDEFAVVTATGGFGDEPSFFDVRVPLPVQGVRLFVDYRDGRGGGGHVRCRFRRRP